MPGTRSISTGVSRDTVRRAACKTGAVSRDLRDVSRDFGLGNATLEDLREAAQAERIHRQAADQILKLITEWENSAWSRNELRMRVRQLTPPPPQSPRGATFYDAGLKAKRRSR